MLLIRHRINTLKDLETVPAHMGIELDLRSEGERLILQHDPFETGEDFENFLKYYRHAFLIANVKAEGLEVPVRELLLKYKIQNYFFLDLSFPALIRLAKQGEHKIAVRFSEFEPIESCLSLKGKVEWVWIDCFSGLPLNAQNVQLLKGYFKLCLVSPELQGHDKEKIVEFRNKTKDFSLDAVCTKYPELWNAPTHPL